MSLLILYHKKNKKSRSKNNGQRFCFNIKSCINSTFKVTVMQIKKSTDEL